MNTKIINISDDISFAVDTAITALKQGQVIAIPTETVYGLAVDFNNLNAIKQIYNLKNRSFDKPLTAFCYSIDQVKDLCEIIPDTFYLLAKEFMPGPISIVLNKKSNISKIIFSNKSTIAVRIPDNEFVLKLIKKFQNPLATSSANLSNQSSLIKSADIVKIFGNKIQYCFDDGITGFKKESTIIDLSKKVPKIIRYGVIGKKEIESVLNIRIK